MKKAADRSRREAEKGIFQKGNKMKKMTRRDCGAMNGAVKKMKRRKVMAAGAALLLLCSSALYGCGTDGNEELRQQTKQEVLAYEQETNEDGVAVDLSENPYFMTEQPGYEYNSPETITYFSEVTGTMRHAGVLLPVDYKAEKEYPVLYLIHGLDGSHRTWGNKDGHIILQNLSYFYDVPEMIAVFPNCAVNETEDTDDLSLKDKIEAYDRTEEELVTSLMPYINSHYSVKSGRDNTAVAGNSMGGRNALNAAFKHPDLFGYVGAFSSAYVLNDSSSGSVMPALIDQFEIDPSAGAFRSVMVCVGKQDDVCGWESYRIHENMTENGVDHIFYDMEGGHEDSVWQNALYNFGRTLFQDGGQ